MLDIERNKMRLYIIRHGETDWNVEGRLQGQSDIELNKNGLRLARVTAEAMKDINFDLCISSPLSRAVKTAEIILKGREVPLLMDDRLMELSFGSWEGLGCHKNNFEIPSDHFDDFYLKPMEFVPGEGGETILELCRRADEFYKDLLENLEYQDKTILIATHGCTVRALMNSALPNEGDFWRGSVPMNCAVNVIDVYSGKADLVEADKVYYGEKDWHDFYSAEA